MLTKVFEIDLSENIQSIPFEPGCDRHRLLIRSEKQPVGWVTLFKKNSGSISIEDLHQAIKKQLGHAVIQQALSKLFDPNQNSSFAFAGISVVVCTRNRTAQLAHCLQTLLALPYPNFEIIVVDNSPNNDDTLQLVSNLPVHYIREERPGLDWARNRGIAKAKHDIIAFTDDDVKVDSYWLQSIAKTFQDKEVMGTSGYVAPAELETKAQHLFELGYGGMGHGFFRWYLRKENLTEKQLLWASSFGIGANMAFRREVFQKIGGFDTALDVGTPSHGAGDVELFHRLVKSGNLFVYEPSMLIWHYHRKGYPALRRQIFDNGRSFGCYLIDCFRKKTVKRSTIIQFFITEWLFKWNLRNLFRHTKVPRMLSLVELYGMVTSPVAYWKTKTWNKKIIKRFS